MLIEAFIGNNREWLGLVIPIWAVLFFISYMSLFPAIYEAEEDNSNPKVMNFIDKSFEYGGRLTVMFTMVFMPIILLGFTFGYFQSHTHDRTKKWFGHVVGFLNVVLIYGLYRYYAPSS